MSATLHDFGKHPGRRVMVVMDGKRTIAVARYYPNHRVWSLRIYDASWADTMQNEAQKAHYARLGFKPDIWPFLKSVKTRRETLRIMTDLAK
jgi:hypothetical protein